MPIWHPDGKEVSGAIEIQLGEPRPSEIHHDDRQFWLVDGHGYSRAVRRDTRLIVGPRRRWQQFLPALPVDPDQGRIDRRARTGSVHVRQRSVRGDDELTKSEG